MYHFKHSNTRSQKSENAVQLLYTDILRLNPVYMHIILQLRSKF